MTERMTERERERFEIIRDAGMKHDPAMALQAALEWIVELLGEERS